MLDPGHLRKYVIKPVLQKLSTVFVGCDSLAAENLMLGTAAVESGLKYLHQIRGPALGLWQVEPVTHQDVLVYLRRKGNQEGRVVDGFRASVGGWEEQLTWNLRYCCAIARIKYWMDPEPLPKSNDIDGLAIYWKRVYNSRHGRGSPSAFIEAYQRLS